MEFFKKLLSRDESQKKEWFPMTLPISEAVLNAAIAKMLSTEAASGQRLKQLVVHVHEGFMDLEGSAATQIGIVNFRASFEIETFELSSRKQEVVLVRRGTVETSIEGFVKRAALYVVEAVLAALFGKTVLDLGLKGREGVKVEGDRIIIDLSRMGLQDKLIEAVKQQAGDRFGLFGGPLGSLGEILVDGVTDNLLKKIELTGVECKAGKLIILMDKINQN